jgi:hypothetical protein
MSQWHFAGGQQSIPRDEVCAQRIDGGWQEFAGAGFPSSEKASNMPKNLEITCID